MKETNVQYCGQSKLKVVCDVTSKTTATVVTIYEQIEWKKMELTKIDALRDAATSDGEQHSTTTVFTGLIKS